MISSPYIRPRFVALVLPMALMWVFAGCVLSCSTLCGFASEHLTVSTETSVDGDECLDCPFVNAPSCGLSGRCTCLSYPNDKPHGESVLRTGLDSSEPVSGAGLPKPTATADPPPLRVSILRI